jgi:hypothetical protein
VRVEGRGSAVGNRGAKKSPKRPKKTKKLTHVVFHSGRASVGGRPSGGGVKAVESVWAACCACAKEPVTMGRSRRSQYNPSRKRRAARPLERVEVPEQDQPEQEELGVREQTGNCKWSSAERFSMFAMLAWTYDYSEVARAEAALYDGDVGDMVERHTSGYAQRMMRAGGDSSAVRMRIEDRMTESNSYQHTKEVCCLLCYPPPPPHLPS